MINIICYRKLKQTQPVRHLTYSTLLSLPSLPFIKFNSKLDGQHNLTMQHSIKF
jgi:hypothetical protein